MGGQIIYLHGIVKVGGGHNKVEGHFCHKVKMSVSGYRE